MIDMTEERCWKYLLANRQAALIAAEAITKYALAEMKAREIRTAEHLTTYEAET